MKKPEGSGRKKGQPNQSKVVRVEDYLHERGINPVKEILELLPALTAKDRVATWVELLKWCEARPKLPDLLIAAGQPAIEDYEHVSSEDLIKLVHSKSDAEET